MQGIMINRKFVGISDFSALLQQTFYIFTFHFFAFSLILDNLQKTKTDTKSRIFAVFARKRPFLSQIMY